MAGRKIVGRFPQSSRDARAKRNNNGRNRAIVQGCLRRFLARLASIDPGERGFERPVPSREQILAR